MARRFLVLLAIAAVAACAQSVPERTFLQADDLVVEDGMTFDANEILDTGSFTDAEGIDILQIQKFLEHTPYGRASFLATYQSNGVRADAALVRAATKYGINPLVFLVHAQVSEGLVGEQFYPSPPSRVEYVFHCGCFAPGNCDPALAGFDVQVDCLGRTLRKSLDQIAANGQTDGGWGPHVASTTSDGKKVTPADEATAALYQYAPKVGTGSDGNWLFWNIWQKYSIAMDYSGPVGNPGGASSWVGDACRNDMQCAYADAICATNYPGGLCTAQCTDACPSSPELPTTFCADFQQAGYCLAVCDPTGPSPCRDGYVCRTVKKFGSPTESASVCVNQ